MCTSPLEKKERREEKRRKGKIYAQKFPRNEERDRLAFLSHANFSKFPNCSNPEPERERGRERRSVPRRHEEEQEREEGRPETNDNAEDIVLKSGAT